MLPALCMQELRIIFNTPVDECDPRLPAHVAVTPCALEPLASVTALHLSFPPLGLMGAAAAIGATLSGSLRRLTLKVRVNLANTAWQPAVTCRHNGQHCWSTGSEHHCPFERDSRAQGSMS
jgi:hypothetical protein